MSRDQGPKAPKPHVEQREFSRIQHPVAVEIGAGERTILGETRDLSLNGAFVATRETFPAGTAVTVSLFLHASADEGRVEARARVVRALADGLALEFDEVVGVDGYWHLRKLITYNAEDVDRVESEFASHVGLRRPSNPPE
jgi:hypothetical protein